MFPYMEDSRHSSGSGIPPFSWHVFHESNPFLMPSCGNIEVMPLLVQHGRDHVPVRRPYTCIGFRIKDFSYICDSRRIKKFRIAMGKNGFSLQKEIIN